MNITEILKKIRQFFTDIWERTDKKDRIRYLMIASVGLVVIFVATVLLTQTNFVPLYQNLDAASSAQVVARLVETDVPYKLENEGSTVLVPEKMKQQLILDFAASDSVPQTGNISYELFAQGAGLTTSDYEKRKYELFQLQEHISVSLVNIEGIKDAIVLLAIPDQDTTFLFQSQIKEATASVMLTLDSNFDPASNPALPVTIENIVSSSVLGLKPENVFISDESGLLLNRRDDLYSTMIGNLEFQKRVESELTNQVLILLRPLFGEDAVRASVNAKLNFDDKVIQNEFFSPVVDEEGIAISSQEIYEHAIGGGAYAGEPGLDENGDIDQYSEVEDTGLEEYEKRTTNINLEVNRVQENITKAKGEIIELTISVIVDNAVVPEDEQDAKTLKAIIGGAIGLLTTEYNVITVAYQPFKGVAIDQAIRDKLEADRRRAELFELIRIIVLYLLIAICLLLIILKTLSLFKKKEPPKSALDMLDDLDSDIDEYGELVKLATTGEQIEIVKSPTRERVEEFIENNPDAVAAMLRNWLSDEENENYNKW